MLNGIEDYEPQVDLTRFPRENLYFPLPEQNKHGAWAWQCSIKDKNFRPGGPLMNKTVVLKDNISVANVPMLLGTDFVKRYTPVRPIFSFRTQKP